MATTYNPRIVTNGLVLCLDAANRQSYPGSGTTWTDLSGNGNNGTLTNGPTFSSDNRGSIVFDGVNDHIITPTTSSIFNFGTGGFSVDVWMRFNSFINAPTIMIFKPYYTSANNFLFFHRNGRLSVYTQTEYNESVASIQVNKIHNIVLNKISPDGIAFYVDGVNTHNATKAINVSGFTSIDLIGDTQFNNDYSNANLYHFKIYNRTLSAAEISQNFNALRGRFGV